MNEYYNVDALNFSTLAAIDSNNPGFVFRERERKQSTEAMNNGSLVDCLLTLSEEFDSLFVVTEGILLSDNIKNIIQCLVRDNLEYTNANLLNVARDSNYGNNWNEDTLLKKVKTDNSKEYYEQLISKDNRIKISQEIYDKAINVVETLKNHEFSSWIFRESEDIEVKFQLPIYWERPCKYAEFEDKRIKCKALLDIVYINHKDKYIIPIDLKIKSDSKYSFPKSFIRFKYYLQASWYSLAIEHYKNKYYPDYDLKTFRFLVTSFEYPDPPLIYLCTNTILLIGFGGGIMENKKVKGVNQLTNDYIWYLETGKYQYPRHIYESKGVIAIDI